MFPRSWLGRCCIFIGLPLCLAAVLVPFLASGQAERVEEMVIKTIDVQHIGPRTVSDALVRANIRVKAGDPYSKLNIDDDVLNLYATGYFFYIDVRQTLENDGVKLLYRVQAKPVLSDIRYEGNDRFSTRKVSKKVTAKVGQPLDEAQLHKDTLAIKDLYEKAGYLKTEVKYSLNIDENAGRGTVIFEIKEAPKQRIERVEFPGHEAFKEKKLRKVVKTRRRWIFSWLTGTGRLKEDVVQEDRERLKDFYRNEGYIDYELKDIKVTETDPKRLHVDFVIDEGRPYKVGSVTFEGNKLFSTNEIISSMESRQGTRVQRGMNLNPGDTFKPRLHARDIDLVEDFYGSRGYIDVQFPGPSLRAIRIPNTSSNTIDLVYRVEEGSQSYIEKIEIKGNSKTKDRVIRRELAVAPGEVFNMVRVKISTNRLYQLQYFDKVDARPEKTEVPTRRNLVIGVEERNTGNFSIGAGFSSVDNLVGFVEMSQGNFDIGNPPYFTGGGQKLRLRAQVGTRRQDYLITFIEPWLFGQRLALQVDLYHRDFQFLSSLYNEQRTGARIGVTKGLNDYFRGGEFFRVGLAYTIESVNLDFDEEDLLPTVTRVDGPGHGSTIVTAPPEISPELAEEEGRRLVSKVTGSIVYDTRNSILPDKGQRVELIGEVAGGPLGGDSDFYRLELRAAQYFRGFDDGHIIEMIGRLGVSQAFGDSTRVPLFDRYFLGGLYTLRGFRYRDVGPVDENHEPVGGSTYWFGSIEYSIPVIERVRLAAFYDIGMVYYEPYSFQLRSPQQHFYNDNWGIGVRLNLPIGPLRLDYAFPITAEDYNDSSGGRFQFGVGYTREF